MSEFSAGLAGAFRRRCNSDTGRTVKMVARAIGVSVDSLDRWLAGEAKMPADKVAALGAYFARSGDHSFVADAFGLAAGAPADSCLWVDANGALHAAPFGHERLVLDALAVRPSDGVDWSGYAVRAMGWVQITLQADRRVVIRLSAQRATAEAVARASAWILQPRDMLAGVTVLVLDGNDWTPHPCDTLAGAVCRLEQAVAGAPGGRMVINVERQPLAAAATDDVMARILKAWDGSLTGAETIARAVADAGGAGRSGLYRFTPRGFVCAGVGNALPISGQIIGKPVKVNGDPLYWDMVEAHLDQTLAEGPTFNTIEVRARGDRGVYQRLAVPVLADGAPAIWATSRMIVSPARVQIQ